MSRLTRFVLREWIVKHAIFLGAWMSAGVGLFASAGQAASFQRVAQSGDAMPVNPAYPDTFRAYDGLGTTPALENGVVAFRGHGNSWVGYFTGTTTPGSLQSLGDSSHPFDAPPTYYNFSTSHLSPMFNPSFDGNQVAVIAETDPHLGTGISPPALYIAHGQQSSLTPLPTGSDYDAAQYHAGHVYYVGNAGGVFDYDIAANHATTIADTTTPIPGGSGNFGGFGDYNNLPHMDASGDKTVFAGFGPTQPPGVRTYQGVFTNLDGSLTKIADNDGEGLPDASPGDTFKYLSFPDVAISAPDDALAFIAVAASYPDGGAVVEYKNGVGMTVARTTDLFPGSAGGLAYGGVSLEGGHIAFVLGDGTGFQRLYTDIGGSLQALVSTGDVLDGHVIDSLSIGTQAIDGDQIAFTLTDAANNRAIYIATVPEPTSLGLLAAAALLPLLRRRRVAIGA
jgi:hypothetical protein